MPEILVIVVIIIIWIFSGVSKSISDSSSALEKKKKFEKERIQKFGDRVIDKTKSLFDRNQDIIEKYKKTISLHSSRYYYIENMTRDCINEICLAEGAKDISPHYDYLSTWQLKAPNEWLELSKLILKSFSEKQNILKNILVKEREKEKNENVLRLLNSYTELINQFNEVAYRKVTTVDAYGEEDWDALIKEAFHLVEKIAKKEGFSDTQTRDWRKNEYSMPVEYKELHAKLTSSFKEYYSTRKNQSVKNTNVSKMSGIDFENHIAQLLREEGIHVSGTPKTGDQGADLIAKINGKTIIIQAKRYESSVGNKAVQEVVGAINFYNGDEGWVITNSSFTKSARELAHKSGVKLIDGIDMENLSTIITNFLYQN
jgi:HJR/Mrr/RecB family endonuclease